MPNPKIKIKNFLPGKSLNGHREKILQGLTSNRKHISSIFFYDDYGSKIFEKITELPEYYLPQKEIIILKQISSELKNNLHNTDIVELGSGDCSKITILLESINSNHRNTIRYLPFDVCQEAIEKSSKILLEKFPPINIQGIIADFFTQLDKIPGKRKRLFCFFGSTIGNFTREKAKEFISNLSDAMKPGETLLLSFDMVKDKDILEKAYNDSKNVTAQFNLNILKVANKHAKTDFNPDDFQHLAFYNRTCSRIEMHLKAKKDLEISSPYLDKSINIKRGESIHTENSHKFTEEKIKNLADFGQLKIKKIFTDDNKWFSVAQLVK
ncbi:MAG: L-histidine N(alpha)-methyltransferase [bacterium]